MSCFQSHNHKKIIKRIRTLPGEVQGKHREPKKTDTNLSRTLRIICISLCNKKSPIISYSKNMFRKYGSKQISILAADCIYLIFTFILLLIKLNSINFQVMRKSNFCLIIMLVFSCLAQLSTAQANDAYLFSYFKGNGEDGLHLAYSNDGLKWTSLKNDRSFLTPAAGKDKLMRDPCLFLGPDGTFHLVWTVSWNEKGIGYASPNDLFNWSDQKYIPVMEHEPGARNCRAPEITCDPKTRIYMIY